MLFGVASVNVGSAPETEQPGKRDETFYQRGERRASVSYLLARGSEEKLKRPLQIAMRAGISSILCS
jgi:hypothetical protein